MSAIADILLIVFLSLLIAAAMVLILINHKD